MSVAGKGTLWILHLRWVSAILGSASVSGAAWYMLDVDTLLAPPVRVSLYSTCVGIYATLLGFLYFAIVSFLPKLNRHALCFGRRTGHYLNLSFFYANVVFLVGLLVSAAGLLFSTKIGIAGLLFEPFSTALAGTMGAALMMSLVLSVVLHHSTVVAAGAPESPAVYYTEVSKGIPHSKREASTH